MGEQQNFTGNWKAPGGESNSQPTVQSGFFTFTKEEGVYSSEVTLQVSDDGPVAEWPSRTAFGGNRPNNAESRSIQVLYLTKLGNTPGPGDSDGDGVDDALEKQMGLDPSKRNTDGVGYADGDWINRTILPPADDYRITTRVVDFEAKVVRKPDLITVNNEQESLSINTDLPASTKFQYTEDPPAHYDLNAALQSKITALSPFPANIPDRSKWPIPEPTFSDNPWDTVATIHYGNGSSYGWARGDQCRIWATIPEPAATAATRTLLKIREESPHGNGFTTVSVTPITFTIPAGATSSNNYEDLIAARPPALPTGPFTGTHHTMFVREKLVPFDIEKASLSEGQFVVNVPDVSSGAVGTLDMVFKKQGGGETIARTIQNQAPGKVVIALDEILTGTTNTPSKPFDNQDASKYDKIYVRWRVGTVDVKTGDRSFDDVQINGQTKKVATVEVLAKRKISNYFSPEWGGTWSGAVRNKGAYRAGEWPASLTNIDVAGKLLDALDPANEGLAMDGTSVIRDRYRPAQAGHPQVTALNGNATIQNEADTQGYTTGYICKPDVDQDNASSPRVTLLRPTSVAVKYRNGGGTDADRLTYDDMVYIPDIPDVHLRTVDDTGGLHGNRDQIDVWRGQAGETLANTVRNYFKPASTCLKVIPAAMP